MAKMSFAVKKIQTWTENVTATESGHIVTGQRGNIRLSAYRNGKSDELAFYYVKDARDKSEIQSDYDAGYYFDTFPQAANFAEHIARQPRGLEGTKYETQPA